MGFIAWIIVGLIVGAIVKAILPGRVHGGWVTSLILGVVGAIIGGWISAAIFGGNAIQGFFHLGTWLWAFIGAIIVAGVYGAITGRNRNAA